MSRVTSQLAICFDCGAEWGDHVNHHARKAAYAHAKRTGHKVNVETVTGVTYN